MRFAGGGGYGDPRGRDREAVVEDIRAGLRVTPTPPGATTASSPRDGQNGSASASTSAAPSPISCCVDERRDLIYTGKRLTTPHDPSEAIVDGLARLLREADTRRRPAAQHRARHHARRQHDHRAHGRRGRADHHRGFRDSLEIGREIRYDLYDLFLDAAAPAGAAPSAGREVSERIDAEGQIVAAARRGRSSRRVAAELVGRRRRGDRRLLHARLPQSRSTSGWPARSSRRSVRDLPLSVSSEVAPEIREFERASTTCANAYVQPLMRALPGPPGRRGSRACGFLGQALRHALQRRHHGRCRRRTAVPHPA